MAASSHTRVRGDPVGVPALRDLPTSAATPQVGAAPAGLLANRSTTHLFSCSAACHFGSLPAPTHVFTISADPFLDPRPEFCPLLPGIFLFLAKTPAAYIVNSLVHTFQ